MSTQRKNLNWLISELRRRNVLRVVAMYAPGAFILLEVMDIITPALSLPPWVVTLTIIILAIGFPVTVVLAWIFDITPEGVKRTEDLDSGSDAVAPPVPGRRKLRLSDVVIVILLAALLIMIYPKIFSLDKLAEIRDPEGKISVAVLPFENLSGDTLFNVWSNGFQNLLISTLSNSNEIAVRQYEAVKNALAANENIKYASLNPLLSREIAEKLDTRTLVIGSILKAGSDVRVNAQLVDAETEEIYRTYQVEGSSEDDLFAMADSLSNFIKNFVEIKKIKEDANTPVYRAVSYSGSSEAYRYFINGIDAMMIDMDMPKAIQWYTRAIESDSTFITPYVFLSFAHMQLGQTRDARYWRNAAYAKREQLAYADMLLVEHMYAEMPDEEISYGQQLVDLDEMNPMYHHLLARVYYKIEDYKEAISIWELALEIHRKWGSDWKNPYVYFLLGDAYHKTGNHKRENEILDLGNSLLPDNFMILQSKAICALSHGEKEQADEILAQYQDIRQNITHCPGMLILSGLGYIYEESGMLQEAEEYYRRTVDIEPENPNWKNTLSWFLIDSEVDIDEGLEMNEKLLERYPGNTLLLDTKGWGLYKKGQYKEAVALLTQAWDNRTSYIHEIYQHLQEAEKALAALN